MYTLVDDTTEIKYNITTKCKSFLLPHTLALITHLGLRSTAANSNTWLINYTFSHGQPVDSILDSVLPLYAALSGGNDLVMKLVIGRT